MNISVFKALILNYYNIHKRSFAWRDTITPYGVVISELMLQQTQTYRVEPKYNAFISELPSFEALAQAPFVQVLSLWKGLGYNRRARYVHEIARRVCSEYGGALPHDVDVLQTFPGIGHATARSIAAFAYNVPTAFIETNIRAVFIEHFFPGYDTVTDKQLMPLVEQALDHDNPREWYYALMDYGVMLKKERKNPARRSAHHVVQSKFQGSNRQVRGKILESLLKHGQLSFDALCTMLLSDPLLAPIDTPKIERALIQLCTDVLVVALDNCIYSLA